MTSALPDALPNERVQDAVDALLLADCVGDLASVRQACVAVFTARNQHRWPPTFTPSPAWADRFAVMASELEMEVRDLATASVQLTVLITAIDAARQPNA